MSIIDNKTQATHWCSILQGYLNLSLSVDQSLMAFKNYKKKSDKRDESKIP
jgi:hypothetical protein